jgi:hypothetical protein
MMPRSNLIGQRFGRLTVLALYGETARHQSVWKCRCDCGNVKTVSGSNLRRNNTQSCGCLRRDVGRMVGAAGRRHGETVNGMSAEYNCWKSMKHRCLNPKARFFQYYGGRGIQICGAWQNSFEAFLADMGRRPSAQHSIDRINNNGDYGPENCRWATKSEQRINQRPAKRSKKHG